MMPIKTLLLVLFFPFLSLSGNGSDSLWLAAFPAVYMQERLSGTPGMQPAEFEPVHGLWSDMLIGGGADRQAVLQYCREKAIRKLVTGTVSRTGEQVRLAAEVIDVDSGVSTPLAVQEGRLSELLSLAARMSDAVATELSVLSDLKGKTLRTEDVRELEAGIHLMLAQLFLGQQNSELAYQEAAAYRQLKPQDPAGAKLVGESAYQLARFEDAAKAYTDLVKFEPGDAAARFALANALRGQGRLPEALRTYRETIGLKPDHAEAHLLLAQLLELLDMTRDAIAAYEAYLKVAPDTAQERPWREKAEAAVLSLRKRLR